MGISSSVRWIVGKSPCIRATCSTDPALRPNPSRWLRSKVLPPCLPTKIVGLWNNFGAAATKNGLDRPPEPLYFYKPASGILAPGGTIVRPGTFDGRVIFEGELGVVIGKHCKDVSMGIGETKAL